MSRPIARHHLASTNQLAPAPELSPNLRQGLETRHFDLPVSLHAAYFGLVLVYLGLMAFGFRSPGMVLPIAICLLFTAAFYVVPAMWSLMGPVHGDRPPSLTALLGEGIQTHTGWCRGSDAVAQVLILPVLILAWGIAVVSIAALV